MFVTLVTQIIKQGKTLKRQPLPSTEEAVFVFFAFCDKKEVVMNERKLLDVGGFSILAGENAAEIMNMLGSSSLPPQHGHNVNASTGGETVTAPVVLHEGELAVEGVAATRAA
jgi:hypothetical protein